MEKTAIKEPDYLLHLYSFSDDPETIRIVSQDDPLEGVFFNHADDIQAAKETLLYKIAQATDTCLQQDLLSLDDASELDISEIEPLSSIRNFNTRFRSKNIYISQQELYEQGDSEVVIGVAVQIVFLQQKLEINYRSLRLPQKQVTISYERLRTAPEVFMESDNDIASSINGSGGVHSTEELAMLMDLAASFEPALRGYSITVADPSMPPPKQEPELSAETPALEQQEKTLEPSTKAKKKKVKKSVDLPQGAQFFVSGRQAALILGIAESTFYTWLDPKSKYFKPDFVKPIRIGQNSVRYGAQELNDWVSAQQNAQPKGGC